MYFLLWAIVAFSLWHLSLEFHPLREKVETIPRVCSWLCLVTCADTEAAMKVSS